MPFTTPAILAVYSMQSIWLYPFPRLQLSLLLTTDSIPLLWIDPVPGTLVVEVFVQSLLLALDPPVVEALLQSPLVPQSKLSMLLALLALPSAFGWLSSTGC